MKHSLLLLGIVGAMAISAPAYSQYIFMDSNGSSSCTTSDVITSSTTSVDVWLDTNHNASGSLAVCPNGAQPLDIFTYGLLIHYSGTGSVSFTGWTNYMDTAHDPSLPGNFTILDLFKTAGNEMSVSYGLPPGVKANPGRYRLGAVNVVVTGTPTLSFSTVASDNTFVPFTGYGTTCDGSVYGNTMALSYDFTDNCGTASGTPTESTTWGKIKQLYR